MGTPELESTLNRATADGKKLLVTYLTAGLPSKTEFLELVSNLAEVSDAIEIGIPFSDPVMDGPVIQDASTRAIESGVTPQLSLDLVEEAAAHVSTPLVVMTYFNPIHKIGEAEFADRLAGAGGQGVIVPDLPFEESSSFRRELADRDIAFPQLVAPTSSASRAAKLAEASTGFVYAVSTMGVTGARETLAASAEETVARIRPKARCPVILGFGISNPVQAVQAANAADGVVVASVLMRLILDGDSGEAVALAKEIREALDATYG